MKERKIGGVLRGVLIGFLFMAAETRGEVPAPATGIEGIILIGPTRGGPVRPGEENSARPLANTAFEVKNTAGAVTSFTTDAAGHFRLPLAPGKYSVGKEAKTRLPRCGPFEVEVTAAGFNQVRWQCDSGIR